MKIETQCLHEGYKPKNSEPRVMPIVQSTTYVYDKTSDVADVFENLTKGLINSLFKTPPPTALKRRSPHLRAVSQQCVPQAVRQLPC